MFHGQAQTARTRRTQHEPVGIQGETLRRQSLGKEFVVHPEIPHVDPALGSAGGPSGLENEDGILRIGPRNPAPNRSAPQPIVVEQAEPGKISQTPHLLPRVPVRLAGPVEPEGTPGLRIEMPLDHGPDLSVQFPAPGPGLILQGLGMHEGAVYPGPEEGVKNPGEPRKTTQNVGALTPSMATFTQAGRPDSRARSSAGSNWSGSETHSPWPPRASTNRS